MVDEPVAPGDIADEESGPVRVFMSYRRADDHHFIGRLHDRLCGAFGDDMVFRDIDSIPAGTNFRSVILRTLNEVDAVVAVIGPRWARQAEDQADDTVADYVYLELAEALKQSKPTIPVLIEETSMPTSDALPADLRLLTEIQAISVHGDPAFRRDSARLIEVIRATVNTDRTRVAQQRREAEERARRADAERSERERLAAELRAEERAARLRLAELEEAATRRQIELESARLADISDKLRLAEAADDVAAVGAPAVEAVAPVRPVEEQVTPAAEDEAVPTVEDEVAPAAEDETVPPAEDAEVTPAPALVVASQAASESAEPAAVPPRTGWLAAGRRPLQALILAASVLGVIALFVDRTYWDTPFDELSYDGAIDVCVWILTLAVAIPLFLGDRPVDQRFVLIGVTASSFFFEFLQASAVVRYGDTGYEEGTWFVLKLLQTACLLVAIWMVRHRNSRPLPSSPRVKVALIALATVSGALVIAAVHDQWSRAGGLVESELVNDRTPFVVWLVFLALGPVGLTLGLSTRQSYGSRVSLATFTTLATVSYVAEALFLDRVFFLDATSWAWAAVAQVPLAAVAWWTVAVSVRKDVSAESLDAA